MGVDKYGVHGMLGRQLYYKELLLMNVFNNVVSAYRSREASENFAAWGVSNKSLVKLLAESEIMAKGTK